MKSYSEYWTRNKSKESLTWGRVRSGEKLVETLEREGILRNGLSILELGFGYNRFLKSLVGKFTFTFVGVDIGKNWVEEAKENFYGNKNLEFYEGDIRKKRTFQKLGQFDLVISLATFQHLYPNFFKTLSYVKLVMKKKSRLVIDLNIGRRKKEMFKGEPFSRIYTEKEVKKEIERKGYRIEKSFRIQHTLEGIWKTCFVIRSKEGKE